MRCATGAFGAPVSRFGWIAVGKVSGFRSGIRFRRGTLSSAVADRSSVSPNDLSLKGESRSIPGWRGKILRTRRGNRLNTSIKFSYENEQFSGGSGDLIVDLRFERLCGASAALSQQSLPS